MYHHHHDYIKSVILLLPLIMIALSAVVIGAMIPTTQYMGRTRATFIHHQMTNPQGRWNSFATIKPYHCRNFHPSSRLYGRQRTPKSGNDQDTGDPKMQRTKGSSNNKTMKKENFPSKICVVCQRPFTWRKKWERSWDEITTCSKKCNGERRSSGTAKTTTTTHPE